MRILLFHTAPVDLVPPLMTAAAALADLGAEVFLVTPGSSPESVQYLERHAVRVLLATDDRRRSTRLDRGLARVGAGVKFLQSLSGVAPDCLWYVGAAAMEWGLLPAVNRQRVVVAQATELHDDSFLAGRVQKRLIARADVVVVPEENRAWILRVTTGSRAKFFVVPNRPLDDTIPRSDGSGKARATFLRFGGSERCRRFLIYQGLVRPGRCLETCIQAFQALADPEVGLLIVGLDCECASFDWLFAMSRDDNRIVLVPRITPPLHLEVTSGCDGGILLYAPWSLNHVYCAPNKLYEYAAFGLGMILPRYPGIERINVEFNIGVLCDPESVESVHAAMVQVLSKSREHWQRAGRTFLERGARVCELYSDILHYLAKTRRTSTSGRPSPSD